LERSYEAKEQIVFIRSAGEALDGKKETALFRKEGAVSERRLAMQVVTQAAQRR